MHVLITGGAGFIGSHLVALHLAQGHKVHVVDDLSTGLRANLAALPGFGEDKSRIFLAFLGKQRGVTPRGWREAVAPFGEPGTTRSVADITDKASLLEVRATKKAIKAATRG